MYTGSNNNMKEFYHQAFWVLGVSWPHCLCMFLLLSPSPLGGFPQTPTLLAQVNQPGFLKKSALNYERERERNTWERERGWEKREKKIFTSLPNSLLSFTWLFDIYRTCQLKKWCSIFFKSIILINKGKV